MLNFKFLQPVSLTEIPVRGAEPDKKPLAETLPFWPEYCELVEFVAEGGAIPRKPFRIDVEPFLAEMKERSPRGGMAAVLLHMRKLLLKMRAEKRLEVFRRGPALYIGPSGTMDGRVRGKRKK